MGMGRVEIAPEVSGITSRDGKWWVVMECAGMGNVAAEGRPGRGTPRGLKPARRD